jgi:hypothetical protein
VQHALDLLRRAHESAPDNACYAYVYAIVELHRRARRGDGAVRASAPAAPAGQRFIDGAGLDRARHRGFGTALWHARELVTLDPVDTWLRSLVSDLEKRQAH